MYRIIVLLIIALISFPLYPQKDSDISVYLVMIEKGESDEVKEMLPEIKRKYPSSPSVYYLEGILSEDGETSVKFFRTVIEKYPKSNYADASLYRLYSYYDAADDPDAASEYLKMLKEDYALSPYVKIISGDDDKNEEIKPGFLYTIQAGAFSNNTNAENLRRKFEKAGYYTVVRDKMVGGSVFKIVYTGRFKSRLEAEDFQVVLNKNYGLKGIITNYPE
jgi:hypothetical protein